MIIEICANSYESAVNAEKGGADRIELCSELGLGGITPSYGLITKVMQDISIPVNILIRPRSGDFTYSDLEFEVMKEDIELCKELKCNGIVSGILYKNHRIDIKRTKELIEFSKPLSFTFHRAFDWTPEPMKAIKELKMLKVDRILTSGQEKKAIDGLGLLKKIGEETADKIIIMPGSGINKTNALLFKNEGFKEIHFSATNSYKNTNTPKLSMSDTGLTDEGSHLISAVEKIKEIRNLVK